MSGIHEFCQIQMAVRGAQKRAVGLKVFLIKTPCILIAVADEILRPLSITFCVEGAT
jgi:hypothetical protein